MHSNTLQGIFPDPKPVHRKNFIKENVRYIKQMQGLVQNMNPPKYTSTRDSNRYMQVQSKVASHLRAPDRSKQLKHTVLKESYSTPSSEVGKPLRKNFELNRQTSMVSRQQNTVNHQQNTVIHQQNTANHQQNTVNQQQNTVNHQQNRVDQQQNTRNHRQGIGNHKQNIGNQQSSLGSHQFGLGHHQQNFGNHLQNFGNHQQNYGNHQQNYGNHQQNYGNHQQNLGAINRDKIQISQMRDFGQVPRRTEDESPEKYTDRSVQTEKSDDIRKIYQQGTIKFPSSSLVKALNSSRKPGKTQMKQPHQDLDRGDSPTEELSPTKNELSARLQNLDLEDRNFIKENMKAVKHKILKSEGNTDPTRAPPTYQKGVVPKYLKDRREENLKDVEEDPDCPTGHVLLPDEERKETLRVLRQSYADRIQELNSMPVRNDTLKMRKRKMDLEEELKKIDEGIKVFQRPKVFVKINA